MVATDCEALAKILAQHRFWKQWVGTAKKSRFHFKCQCGFVLGEERRDYREYRGDENDMTLKELAVWEKHISEVLFVEINEDI